MRIFHKDLGDPLTPKYSITVLIEKDLGKVLQRVFKEYLGKNYRRFSESIQRFRRTKNPDRKIFRKSPIYEYRTHL